MYLTCCIWLLLGGWWRRSARVLVFVNCSYLFFPLTYVSFFKFVLYLLIVSLFHCCLGHSVSLGSLFYVLLLCLVSPVYGGNVDTNTCADTLNCRTGAQMKDAKGNIQKECEDAVTQKYPTQCPPGSEMTRSRYIRQGPARGDCKSGADFSLTCKQCSKGTFVKGYTYCKAVYHPNQNVLPCPIDSPVCTNCPNGQIAPMPGAGMCQKCAAGMYWTDKTTPCKKCDAGRYRPGIKSGEDVQDYDASPCVNCASGFFQAGLGQLECIECPLGQQSYWDSKPDEWYVSFSGVFIFIFSSSPVFVT